MKRNGNSNARGVRSAVGGIMELMPSMRPRVFSSPQSVIHALKAAPLAEEPKNVIRQSKMMSNVTPSVAAFAAEPAMGVKKSIQTRAKTRMESPQ
ncbi:MAG: hypothetical protein HFI76_03715 [Lachnospiraceae bacterium]|nr:hypothetical protein [Lachnospiraceae bacterium]